MGDLSTLAGLIERTACTLDIAGYKVKRDAVIMGHVCAIVVPKYRIIVEVMENPPGPLDELRMTALRMNGWKLLEFTTDCVRYHLDAIVETVQVTCGDREFADSIISRPLEEWHVAFKDQRATRRAS